MKEMGPSSRHDILDDQFHYHNWCKYIAMGTCLLECLLLAVELTIMIGTALAKKRMVARCELKRQMEVHQVFTDCLPSTELTQKWMDKVTAWENDMDGTASPYMTEVEHKSSLIWTGR